MADEQGYTPAQGTSPGQRPYPFNTFVNGIWLVDVDIVPGLYSSMGPPFGQRVEYPCTIARLQSPDKGIDDPGNVLEVKDFWHEGEFHEFMVHPGDVAVYASNCQEWVNMVPLGPTATPDSRPPGTEDRVFPATTSAPER